MTKEQVVCKIEHHAVLFALLAKYTLNFAGDDGEDILFKVVANYGHERGNRMAANAQRFGDPLSTANSQVYGEWKPDYEGQMDFGVMRYEPSLQTYIAKCAWCDAWQKHGLMDYGKYYCVNIDNAWYQGFNPEKVCTQLKKPMSWGGKRCEFDWEDAVSSEEQAAMKARKEEIGTSCMHDFNFHTGHLLASFRSSLEKEAGDIAELVLNNAVNDFTEMFSEEYLTVAKESFQS